MAAIYRAIAFRQSSRVTDLVNTVIPALPSDKHFLIKNIALALFEKNVILLNVHIHTNAVGSTANNKYFGSFVLDDISGFSFPVFITMNPLEELLIRWINVRTLNPSGRVNAIIGGIEIEDQP